MISWGNTASNCAIVGLAALLTREEWRTHPESERLREPLRTQLANPDETARMLASTALPSLVDQEDLSRLLSDRLSSESSPNVREVLVSTLAQHAPIDPDGIDACLARLATLPNWAFLAATPEDRSVPPNKRRNEIGDQLIRVVLYLANVPEAAFASELVARWLSEPKKHPATLGRLIAWSRPHLNPPEDEAPIQIRTFKTFSALANKCLSVIVAAEQHSASGHNLDDEQVQDLQASAWIIHCMAQELYHASGAFQTQEQRLQPDLRVVRPGFCSLAFPLIEMLGTFRAAEPAHHLVQTLVFLSRREPKRAFLAVADIVVLPSGYAAESLAQTEVLDLIDVYLAERRHVILDDAECLSALRRILGAFVAVGNDRAIHRVQNLRELFT